MGDWDRQLVDRAVGGDQQAMAALHGRHAPAVQAYFMRSGFALADAQDLTQETFLRAFRALGTFDAERAGLRTWLGAIARNLARQRWRRGRPAEGYDGELAAETLADEPNPAESPEAREELAALRECIAQLPDGLGRVVRLRYVEARTTRGIAGEMDLPEATVRLRLDEARGALQRCMRGKGFVQ